MKFAVIILSILAILPYSVFAIGISPGNVDVNFEPNTNKTFEFYIINPLDQGAEASVYAEGEFSQYIETPKGNIILGPKESKLLSYTINFPASIRPGENVVHITASEQAGSLGGISAITRAQQRLVIHVPFPALYLDFGINPKDVLIGDDANISVYINNLGNLSTDFSGKVIFTNPNNKTVYESDISGFMDPKDSMKFPIIMPTKNLSLGVYTISVSIAYGGENATASSSFRIGKQGLNIEDFYSRDGFLYLIVSNLGINNIDDVWAEIFFEKEYLKTRGGYLVPGETKALSIKADLSSFYTGNYTAKVRLHYGSNLIEKDMPLFVTGRTNYSVYIIVAGGLLVIASVAMIFGKRKNRKS